MKSSLLVVCIWVFITSMWVVNLVKFTNLDFQGPDLKAEIIRGIGIPVFFLGVVTGGMDIGEENNED